MRPAHILMACLTSAVLYSTAPATAWAGPAQGTSVSGGAFCAQEAQDAGILGFLAPLLCGATAVAPDSLPDARGWSIEHRGWSIEHAPRIDPTPGGYQGWSIEHRGWSIEHRGWSIEHAHGGE